jgi:hypothetical protein
VFSHFSFTFLSYCRQLEVKVNADCDDWDEHLNHALLDIRIRKHTATRYSPFDMFHSWNFRFDPSAEESPEENDVLEALNSDDPEVNIQLELLISKACEKTFSRFDAVRDELVENAAANIHKEQLRQRKAFDNKHLGKGAEINRGFTSHNS